ncbi:hypothetical protein NDU88_002695 [Pleurodeles waltl]|uniref:Uncharacterized protein n=1 Tax=Pleurodeles waltl TaxID=8319 RepID=A0AAV7QCI0_PLEWA|nr:hypothetical protein NDU88_002695 [Pleurodeles waltl]
MGPRLTSGQALALPQAYFALAACPTHIPLRCLQCARPLSLPPTPPRGCSVSPGPCVSAKDGPVYLSPQHVADVDSGIASPELSMLAECAAHLGKGVDQPLVL